ncbi:jg27493, partial [Pararge aegeria aegeria]
KVERQPLEKSGEVLSSEPQNPNDDHDQSVKTETTRKKKTFFGDLPVAERFPWVRFLTGL